MNGNEEFKDNYNDTSFEQQSLHNEAQADDVSMKGEQHAMSLELERCRLELSEWKDRSVRFAADLENFKRRMTREQENWSESAQSRVFGELLPIVDNFDRALAQLSATPGTKDVDSWRAGLDLIRSSLGKMLTKFGVERMDNYGSFNPEFHEALTQVESPDKESGQIVEVLEQGYLFKGKVLRPARVTVAK